MRPDKCLCNGELCEGRTKFFFARVVDKVVIVKDILAYICERCEETYSRRIFLEKIDRIMIEFHEERSLMVQLLEN